MTSSLMAWALPGTDWKLARDGYADTQAAIEIHGAVQGEGPWWMVS